MLRTMGPGTDSDTRALMRCLAAAAGLAALLVAPAAAGAETASVSVDSTQLRVVGIPKSASKVELRYKTAAEAGFGGLVPRFVITDPGGIQAVNPDCVLVDPTTASCDASLVKSISAYLGDGDDVLAINASKGDAVPRSFPT